MFKQFLIMVILSIVIYQLYIVKNQENEKLTKEKVVTKNQEHHRVISKLPQRKPMQYETPQSFEHPSLGKPDKIIQEGYLYIIQNPNPWNAIVYNSNTESYLFIIRLNENPTTIQRYNQKIMHWTKIVGNISLNTQSNELIIPSSDENSALAIVNLVLNNLRGDLTLKDIIDKKLIHISIAKIQNYSSVKQKIKEQILENISGVQQNQDKNIEYQEDLAETISSSSSPRVNLKEKNKNNQPLAYEGLEFSYL